MPKILVVDDEPLIAMMMSDWLLDEGHEVVGPAHSIAQALTAIETHDIDCAVLDVSLGDSDSYPVAEALVARSVPFAFATGHGRGSVDPRFKAAPVIAKPFDFEAVRLAVQTLVEAPKA